MIDTNKIRQMLYDMKNDSYWGLVYQVAYDLFQKGKVSSTSEDVPASHLSDIYQIRLENVKEKDPQYKYNYKGFEQTVEQLEKCNGNLAIVSAVGLDNEAILFYDNVNQAIVGCIVINHNEHQKKYFDK